MSITDGNWRLFDLNLLRVLHALFLTRSVSQSALLLRQSQPAVSRALGRLRDHFGDPLFVRGRGAMIPTSRAVRIEPLLNEVIETIGVLLAPPSFDPRTIARELVIAGSDFFEAVLLPPLICGLQKAAPGISLRCVPFTDSAWNDLENRALDLIVAPQRRIPPNLKQRLILTADYVCIASPSNPHVKNGLDLETFFRLSHLQVKIGPENSGSGAIDALFKKENRIRKVAATISTLFSAGPIVSRSDLIAVMPRQVAVMDAETLPLEILPLPFDLPAARVSMAWHPRVQQDPAHKFFRDLLASVTR